MARLTRRFDAPLYNDYRKYKRFLREDFCYCCVYCTIHENENGGPRNFHVEHYRPKVLFPHLETTYHNLLYACAICNSYKLDDWPSDDPLNDGLGYLDPCEHDYEEHFAYTVTFEIVSKSSVARYMIERLHLNRPQLRKIRQLRHRDDTFYEKMMTLDIVLDEIEQLLQNQLVPPTLAASLQQFIVAAREQYATKKEIWEGRWEPEIDLNDYR